MNIQWLENLIWYDGPLLELFAIDIPHKTMIGLALADGYEEMLDPWHGAVVNIDDLLAFLNKDIDLLTLMKERASSNWIFDGCIHPIRARPATSQEIENTEIFPEPGFIWDFSPENIFSLQTKVQTSILRE